MQAKSRMNRCLSALLLLTAVLSGCSADKKADAAQPKPLAEGSVAPRPTVVSQPTEPYRAVAVSGGGRLSGTIDFDGVIPPDSVIELPADQMGCGKSITDRRVERTGTKIGGVVVWLTDIRSGKALPLERRFELANEDCVLNPRIQAVFAPATLNVASEDVALHRNRFINVGTGQVEAIAPFNDNGEVVPFDKLLDKTEQLEITCEVHPWAKAWILVFDHPYFATTAKTGTFAIDDIPPGTYHVKAWHPLLGIAEQSVTIAAGQPATIAMKLAAGAPGALPTASRDTAPAAASATSAGDSAGAKR
jgi:Polysaccharide lyase family 4, domain II